MEALTKQQIIKIEHYALQRDLSFVDNMNGSVSIEDCILDTYTDCINFLKNIPVVK